MMRWLSRARLAGVSSLIAVTVAGCVGQATATPTSNASKNQATREQILRGRQMVIEHDCGGCHGG
ncbi:MAG: hypothetical protein Q7S20_08700 [Gemmatimonadaceae bacterium]|nr:hypothetical protein [Gemmatimonadaceae bacterium]